MRPATVIMDLREIAQRAKLWQDKLNGDLANTQSTYESIVQRRIDTWTETMFEHLYWRANGLGWLDKNNAHTAPASYARGKLNDILNHEARQGRLHARLDELLGVQLAAVIDEVSHDQEAYGSW